jgi:hypothetical protein
VAHLEELHGELAVGEAAAAELEIAAAGALVAELALHAHAQAVDLLRDAAEVVDVRVRGLVRDRDGLGAELGIPRRGAGAQQGEALPGGGAGGARG